MTSVSDPDLQRAPTAQLVINYLVRCGVQARLERSGGNVWTVFTLVPTCAIGPYHEDGSTVERSVTVHNDETGRHARCKKVIDVLNAMFPDGPPAREVLGEPRS